MIDPAIFASMPAQFVGDPTIRRVGMLLFREGQPGIVAHMVEGGGLAKAASTIAMGTNPVAATVSAGAQVAQLVQNEQVKAGMAALKTLQLQNLVLSGVGIGVSLLSHQLTMQKLSVIDTRMQGIETQLEKISRQISELKDERIKQDFIELRAETLRAEDAWALSDPQSEWRAVSAPLNLLKERFLQRAREVIQSGNPDAGTPFVDAFGVAANAQISCRVASGDLEQAINLAHRFADDLSGLLRPFGASEFLVAALNDAGLSPGSADYVLRLSSELPRAHIKAAMWREQQMIAQSLPATLEHLRDHDIDGRSWIEHAREKEDESILLMVNEPIAV